MKLPGTKGAPPSPLEPKRRGSLTDTLRAFMAEANVFGGGRVPKGFTCRGQRSAEQGTAFMVAEATPLRAAPGWEGHGVLPSGVRSRIHWPYVTGADGRREHLVSGGDFEDVLEKDKLFACAYASIACEERARIAELWEAGDARALRSVLSPPGVLKQRSSNKLSLQLDSSTESILTPTSSSGSAATPNKHISFADPPVVSMALISPRKPHASRGHYRPRQSARVVHVPNAFVAVAHHKRMTAGAKQARVPGHHRQQKQHRHARHGGTRQSSVEA